METKPLSRIVLGLTGGIAAYKAAELTRLFVKADIVVDVCMTGRRMPLRDAVDAAGAVGSTGPHRHVAIGRRQRNGPYQPVARRGCRRRRAGIGGFSRQDRQRACRRPPVHADAGARLPAVRRARDEPPDVVERRQPAQRRATHRRWRRRAGSRQRRSGLRRDGRRPHAGAGRNTCSRPCLGATEAARRTPFPAYRRPDARSDRSGAQHHQHELRQDGLRACAGRRRGGRDGDARQRTDAARHPCGRRTDRRR